VSIDSILDEFTDHLSRNFGPQRTRTLAEIFSRDGVVVMSDLIPKRTWTMVSDEVRRLLDAFAERRDLFLATTSYTPRKMSVIMSNTLQAESPLVMRVYEHAGLRDSLGRIARDEMVCYPAPDEAGFISKQERAGDEHGWHWGDFSFALLWLIEMPPVECGGLPQCVPHTSWDKSNPRVYEYLCDRMIQTHRVKTGDVYLQKTNTTLHRTMPLNKDATRIMLNLTYGSPSDPKEVQSDDRWWENAASSDAVPIRAGQ